VSIYLDPRSASVHVDGDHVEAAGPVMQAVPGQIVYGHLSEATLFPRRQRLGSAAELLANPRLDLDEHRRAALRCDNVDFAEFGSVATIKNCVPKALKFSAREIFAVFSEDLPGIV
jgi:hypothetical protein